MPQREPIDLDLQAAPFTRLRNIRRLGSDRSGHASFEHARHGLYVAGDPGSRTNVLIKVTTKPGLVYERNLTNELATLTTINGALPESRTFPTLWDHGRLGDGRLFLIMSLFDEWPLATTIGPDRMPARLVGHLRTSLAIADALLQLHRIPVFHVDLNPMNVLFRWERGGPVIRIVDFESSFDATRQKAGEAHDPPTTPGFSAPEVAQGPLDGRADVFSLGAVLYTLLAGYGWTWSSEVWSSVEADRDVDPELRAILRSATQPDPARRCPSMGDLRTALAAYLESIWPGRTP